MSQKISLYIVYLYLCISFFVLGAAAQTVTTNGGTTNSVPKFSGPTTIVNSAVTENNGQVGIGTASPQATLHVSGNNAPGAIIEAQDSLLFGSTFCCGAGPTGSSIGSSGGWSSFYNGAYFNSNGTATGGAGGAQLNSAVPSWRMALGSGTNEWPGGDNFVVARVPASGNYSAPSILLKVDASGILHSAGGIVFPDGSLQTKAQLAGPQGPKGDTGATGLQGPPGPGSTSAVCAQNNSSGASCSCAVRLVAQLVAPFGATSTSCTVTSNTGSCSASGGPSSSGACCVCAPN